MFGGGRRTGKARSYGGGSAFCNGVEDEEGGGGSLGALIGCWRGSSFFLQMRARLPCGAQLNVLAGEDEQIV
jgi:hypothetical protein